MENYRYEYTRDPFGKDPAGDETQRLIDAGNHIIDLLNLKVKDNGRVDTTDGDRTPLGLALMLKRYLGEEEEDES